MSGRAILGGAALAVGTLVLCVAIVEVWASGTIDRLTKEHDRLVREMSHHVVENRPVPIGEPIEGNARDRYQIAWDAVAAEGVQAVNAALPGESALDPLPEAPLDGAQRAMLERLEPAWDALEKGARCTRYSRDLDLADPRMQNLDFMSCRALGHAAVGGSRALVADSRDGDALDLAVRMERYAQDVETEPLISRMIGIALEGMAARAALIAIHASGASPKDLRATIRRLLVLDGARTGMRDAWRGERAYMGTFMIDLLSPTPRLQWLPSWPPTLLQRIGMHSRPAIAHAWRGSDDFYGHAEAVTSTGAMATLVSSSRSRNPLLDEMLPNAVEALRADEEGRAISRLVIAVAAIRVHVLEHDGHFPAKLEDLVPDPLPAVPVDPQTGLPFKYEVDSGTGPARVIGAGRIRFETK